MTIEYFNVDSAWLAPASERSGSNRPFGIHCHGHGPDERRGQQLVHEAERPFGGRAGMEEHLVRRPGAFPAAEVRRRERLTDGFGKLSVVETTAAAERSRATLSGLIRAASIRPGASKTTSGRSATQNSETQSSCGR